jgi:hypothetical protein
MDEDEKTEDESEREYRHPRPPFLIFSPVQVQRSSAVFTKFEIAIFRVTCIYF